ncbi:MAG: NUDIX domain-containing protein [Tabrizicola sp.]|nr:NUDIX domain-containing protein [Tabrizicola sp.]
MDFIGCKVALFSGLTILTYLRDEKPGLRWPGLWDLPGGGREGEESPEDCVLREVEEEFGLRLPPERLILRRVLPSMMDATRASVFYAGRLSADEIAAIRFGEEGQCWEMMAIAAFLDHDRAVPEMQRRAAQAAADLGLA